MATITIELPDETVAQLEEEAKTRGLTIEQVTAERVLHRDRAEQRSFGEALDYVLQKNAKLYCLMAAPDE